MKAMILSTSTGQGHNSASLAIAEGLNNLGFEVILGDVFNLKNKKISEHASKLYSSVIVHSPKLFGIVYHIGDFVSSTKITSPLYISNSRYSSYLRNKLDEIKPDIIICPHVFPAETITNIKKKYGLDIPTVGVLTDYTCTPFWEETRMDYTIIPHESLIPEFVSHGFKKQKLLPLGIPVRSEFRETTDKITSRNKFGLKEGKLYTIIGGSMGYGRMEDIAKQLLEKDKECEIAFVCARNQQLYNHMKEFERICAFNFIDNIGQLMDASDVLLTKPGGLSSTEAINKGVPLVLTAPIPGCEPKNEEFLKRFGVALIAKDSSDAANKAICLSRHEKLKQKQIDAQRQFISINSQKEICKTIIKIISTDKII